jgi:hypothetical protein
MGGKKPVGAEPSRGHCRSRRVRHLADVTNFAEKADESAGFSLFSGPDGLHPWLTSKESDAGNNVQTESAKNRGTDTEAELVSLRNEIADLKERLQKVENCLLCLSKAPEGSELESTPSLDSKHPRLRTIEGRQAAMQSKFTLLDAAFGGCSSSAWQRGTRLLKAMLIAATNMQMPSLPDFQATKSSGDACSVDTFPVSPADGTDTAGVDKQVDDMGSTSVHGRRDESNLKPSKIKKKKAKKAHDSPSATQTSNPAASYDDGPIASEHVNYEYPRRDSYMYIPAYGTVLPVMPTYPFSPLAPYESYQYIPYASYNGFCHYDHYGTAMEYGSQDTNCQFRERTEGPSNNECVTDARDPGVSEEYAVGSDVG